MRTIVLAFWLWIGICPAGQPVSAQGSADDYQRSERLAAQARSLPVSGLVRPNWIGTGARFWYRNASSNGKTEWVLVDPASGKVRRFASEVDMRKEMGSGAGETALPMLSQVPAASGGDAETEIVFQNDLRIPVELSWAPSPGERRRYATLAPGGRRAQHTFAGHVWVAHTREGRFLGAWKATESAGLARVGGEPVSPDSATRRSRGAMSPDGRWSVTVENHNLFLSGVEGGERRSLTTDGKSSDRYAISDVFWSPDSRRLVAFRTEPAQERTIHIVESSPNDQLQPRLKSLEYLKPGDRIAHPRPVLIDVESGNALAVSDNLFPNPWSLTQLGKDPWRDGVTWAPDGSAFWFVYNERGHQRLRILRVDAQTASVTMIHDESSPTFIDYADKFHAEYLPAMGAILWMSERDGWNHLFLVDAVTGGMRNQVTRGEWVVRDVEQVDSSGQVWFRALGIQPGQDPYHVHLARVGLDGQGFTVLTEGDGTHRVEFSPDRRFFIDTWSRVDQPPVSELRRASDGKLVTDLERGNAAALKRLGVHPPERFVAKGRDGRTDIWGVVYRPSNYDASRRYPVIEQIYAGPQGHFVPKTWSSWHGQPQALAELGFVVVQIDGMGTNWRSKAFHDVCWRNLKDAGFPDRIAWMRALAVKDKSLDLSRVGVYGGSAGGQNALAALIWHGDFYKAAVADCGCHDNRMDKIWWNELWMGWPIGDHYAANSNTVHAGKVVGKLMLVVGELDTNVDPATTMQVASTLVKADRDFDLLVIPGAGHGAAETPYGRRRRQDFLVRHLIGREPRWVKGAGGAANPSRAGGPATHGNAVPSTGKGK